MLALILLTFTVVSGEYIFTFPLALEAGSKTSFCLILNDLDLDSFELLQDFTVNVNLTYLPSDDTTGYMPDNYDFKFGAVNMDRAFTKCHEVETPFVVDGKFSVVVNVSLTYWKDGASKEVDIFGAENMVTVKRPDVITLVQTDKPIYKPGETVKFRVMTMDNKLMSRTDGYQQITIETPNGLKVMQWDDIPSPTGLVSLEMPLSSDPVLGSWMIKVLYGSKEIKQSFKVDEYVLPKFEITITPPKYLLPMTKDIRGTVCAKYTYGKPVKGDLIIEVCFKNPNRRNRLGLCAYLIRKINGCYEFFIPAKSVKLGYKGYGLSRFLTITANITEEQTGIELSGYSVGPGISNIPVTVRIEDDSKNYFKPGLPYNGRVVVTNPDGSPAAGEDIRVEAYSYDHDERWSKIFTTDDTGIIHFTIIGISSNIETLIVQADLIENETDWRYKFDGIHYSTYRRRAFTKMTKLFSPSNSYVYIPKVDTIADCDSELNLNVYFTAETGVDYIFTTFVKAGDSIIYTEVKDIKATDSIYNTDILDIDQNLVIPRKERKPTMWRPPTRRGLENCDNKPILKESVEPEVASNTREDREKRDTGDKLVGYFKLSIPVTKDMGPNAEILVFYMRDVNKEMVASKVEIKVKSCFKNKVTMSFDEVNVKPGANVNLNVGASPSSTCFVGMLDKSVTLLGGNNQLTPGQLFEKVKKVSRRKHHVSYWKDDKAYCDKKTDAKEPELPYTYAVPLSVGAEQFFRDVNLWVETDGNLQSRPCSRRRGLYEVLIRKSDRVKDGEIEDQMRRLFEASPGGVQKNDRIDTASEISYADTVSTESETIESIDVRTYFPETWLWDIISIGEDGLLNITTTIPDTITEWIGNTVCTHESDGVGVTEMTGVTAFKPFFVSLTLPYSAIRGEVLPIVVTVFNYLSDCITLEVLFKETEGFLFSESSARSRQFCLCGENSESTKFFIIPTIIGEIDLEVIAVSIDAVDLCRDVVLGEIEIGVTDGVQRQLLIEPEGAPQEQTKSYFLCVQESEIKTEVVELNLPEDVVDSSERATVSVVGDVMGPTLTNLKNLLRMPYGCGEQNMASLSPNIYVLRYLENTEQLTEELENQAEGYMRIGYQRQMKYRHNDHSYSAWGENRYGNATGSLWLTAFVVKSMAQSSAYIVVDKEDIIRSARWLVSHQLDNGCFPQVGKVFHYSLKGGLGGHNPAGLTAFTLIALVQADLGKEFEYNINNGFHSCLDSFHPNDIDTYTLSLMLYAYTLFELEGPRRRNVLEELNRRRFNKDGLVHWQRGDEEEAETNDNFYWYRAPSAEVEMTSYILLSMLGQGHDVIGDAQAIVQWLSKQRNPYGGFSSTQDTVVALQALAEYGRLTYSEGTTARVEVKNQVVHHVFSVTPKTSIEYQSMDIDPNDGPLVLTMTGSGCVLFQVNMKYNIYTEDENVPAFWVKVNTFSRRQSRNCAVKTVEVCASYMKRGVSNMAIAEVKMPTGWIPVSSTLNELLKSKKIQKIEVNKNFVELYFDELSSTLTCVDFDVEQEIRLDSKPALVKVYDYYETRYSVTHNYTLETVCGMKDEIPVNNEDSDCSNENCRVDTPKESVITCPVCLESIDSYTLVELFCESENVYKSFVRRKGQYSIQLETNVRVKEKKRFHKFVNYNMSHLCSCPIIKDGPETKAFIFAKSDAFDASTESLSLLGSVTVLAYKGRYERVINILSSETQACYKLICLKRSSAPFSVVRFDALLRKLQFYA